MRAHARALPETSFCASIVQATSKFIPFNFRFGAAAQGGPPERSACASLCESLCRAPINARGEKVYAFERGRHPPQISILSIRTRHFLAECIARRRPRSWKRLSKWVPNSKSNRIERARLAIEDEEKGEEGEEKGETTGRSGTLIRRGCRRAPSPGPAPFCSNRSHEHRLHHGQQRSRSRSLPFAARGRRDSPSNGGCQSRDDRGQRDETRSFRGIPFLAEVRARREPALSQPPASVGHARVPAATSLTHELTFFFRRRNT